jgi:hypothetical protein
LFFEGPAFFSAWSSIRAWPNAARKKEDKKKKEEERRRAERKTREKARLMAALGQDLMELQAEKNAGPSKNKKCPNYPSLLKGQCYCC